MLSGTHDAKHDPRNADILIYVNGEYFIRNEAKISVFDSGYLVGDGVWEGLRFKDGVFLFLKQHFDRLWDSAKVIGIELPFSRLELESLMFEVISKNNITEGDIHMRVMITRGIKKTPSQDPRLTISGPNIVIIAEYKTANPETKKNGIRLHTVSFRRGRPDYLNPRLNCHSKLHEVQALMQALQAGADEALMLDINGFVSTCNATNFFMVKNNEIWTSTGQYCMNGITRQNVIKLALSLNIPIYQKDFSLFDVYSAEESFVTGSFGGITPVVEIDGKPIDAVSNFKIVPQLQKAYDELKMEEIRNGKSTN